MNRNKNSFEKRRKELERKRHAAEKLARRRDRKRLREDGTREEKAEPQSE